MDATREQIAAVVGRFIDRDCQNVIAYLSDELMKLHGWRCWDESSPPPFGRYVIWDARLRDPSQPLFWTYRPVERLDMGRQWGMKPGSGQWFNEGGWAADGAPSHYHALPDIRALATTHQEPTP